MLKLLTLEILLFAELLSAFTLVGTANRAGELEPCGCQVNQIGGINRMAEWLLFQRKVDEVFVADSGDTFFSAPTVPETRIPMERMRALTIADAYREMSVSWMTPGERDLALGVDFLRELGKRSRLTFIVSNAKEKLGDGFQTAATFKSKEGEVGVLGLVSKEVFGDSFKLEDPFECTERSVKEFKERGIEKVVILSHLGLSDDRRLISQFKNIIVLGSHSLDPIVEKNKETQSTLLQPQHEGQQITAFTSGLGALIELTKKYDKENEVARIVRHYHEVRGIAKANERVTPVVASAKKPYVANPHKCRSCHEEQYLFWEKTKHSSSILVLYAKKQHKNPECIVCHSLGYRQPGGFSSIKDAGPENVLKEVFKGDEGGSLDSRTDPARYESLKKKYHAIELKKNYWGTQCEHCHGNRNGHPGSGRTQKKVSAETCVQCHRPPNAQEFDPGTIANVACPLMKKEKEPGR